MLHLGFVFRVGTINGKSCPGRTIAFGLIASAEIGNWLGTRKRILVVFCVFVFVFVFVFVCVCVFGKGFS